MPASKVVGVGGVDCAFSSILFSHVMSIFHILDLLISPPLGWVEGGSSE